MLESVSVKLKISYPFETQGKITPKNSMLIQKLAVTHLTNIARIFNGDVF
jgi:hypothetical protein